MNKVEMTLREVYDEVLLDIYNNAVESIKLVGESELKKELVVNYIKSLNIILLNGLRDEGVTVNDFNYLVLQVNGLANELLKYIKDEHIFIKSSRMYYGLKFGVLCNSYINLFNEILYCAFLDDFITLDDFKELTKYADKITRYLRECLE